MLIPVIPPPGHLESAGDDDTRRGSDQGYVIGRRLTGHPVTDLQVIDEVESAGSSGLVLTAAERLRGQRWIAHLGGLAQQRGLRLSTQETNEMVIVLDADRMTASIKRHPSCSGRQVPGMPAEAPEVSDRGRRSDHPSYGPRLRLISGGATDGPPQG
jgi:hypothetical protein